MLNFGGVLTDHQSFWMEVNFQLPSRGVYHLPKTYKNCSKTQGPSESTLQKSPKLSSSQVLALVFKHTIFESTHSYTLNIRKKYKWNFPAKFPKGEQCVKSKDGSKWFQLRNREVSTGLILCQPDPGSFCKSPFTKKAINICSIKLKEVKSKEHSRKSDFSKKQKNTISKS